MTAAATCWIITRYPSPSAATIPTMANMGPKKEKVPPWIIGSRLPIGDCWIRVVMPDTKNMVEMRRASSSWGSFMAPPTIKGISTVAPNMVRYC